MGKNKTPEIRIPVVGTMTEAETTRFYDLKDEYRKVYGKHKGRVDAIQAEVSALSPKIMGN